MRLVTYRKGSSKPRVGALLNEAKQAVEARRAEAAERLGREQLSRRLTEERADVTLPGRQRPRGHVHPLRAVERDIVAIFLAMVVLLPFPKNRRG